MCRLAGARVMAAEVRVKTMKDGGARIELNNPDNDFGILEAEVKDAADATEAPALIDVASKMALRLKKVKTADRAKVQSQERIHELPGDQLKAKTLEVRTLKNGGAAIDLPNEDHEVDEFEGESRDAAGGAPGTARAAQRS